MMVSEAEAKRIESGLKHAMDGPRCRNQILIDFWAVFQEYKELKADNAALRTDLASALTEIARLRAELEPIQGMMDGLSKAWTDPADAVACEGT